MRGSTYGFWQALWRCWYSKDFYKDVGDNWHGTGFGYLFGLLFLCTLVVSIVLNMHLQSIITTWEQSSFQQIPTMHFKDGTMQTDSQGVQVINTPAGEPFVVVDTVGKYTKEHMPNAPVLMTSTAAYVSSTDGSVKEYSYKELGSMDISADSVTKVVHATKYWLIFLLVAGILISVYVYRILLSLIYALLGEIVRMACKWHLPYLSLLRVTVVAQTPVLLLGTLVLVVPVYVTHLWVLGWIINLSYIFFGIHAAKRTEAASAAPSEPQQPTV